MPGSFENYNPSAASLIQQAVDETSGQYPSYNGMSIDAEFSNDIDNPTRDGTSWAPYLVSVEEPISPSCDLSPAETRGNGWGLSQKGAIRWAKGNQCAGSGDQPWPIAWTDYRQILTHYYTGIDILDTNGNKVAPDDRWNLLWHNIPTQMNPGQTIQANIWLQNTSTQSWTDAVLGYQWTGPAGATAWSENPLPNMPMPPGNDQKVPLAITAPADGKTYTTLRLDVKRGNGPWFSEQAPGWPDVEIPVQVVAATPTPTSTFTPTATLVSSCGTGRPGPFYRFTDIGTWGSVTGSCTGADVLDCSVSYVLGGNTGYGQWQSFGFSWLPPGYTGSYVVKINSYSGNYNDPWWPNRNVPSSYSDCYDVENAPSGYPIDF